MYRHLELNVIYNKALTQIAKDQLDTGSFLANSRPLNSSRISARYSSPFFTALILNALRDIQQNEVAEQICTKATNYIISQKSEVWSFNYWERGSKESVESPYPDDLDDSVAAIRAIHSHDNSLLTGDALAKIVSLLTTNEVKPSGPYRTWLVAKDAKQDWLDVDIAVNAHIAFLLGELKVELKGLNRYLSNAINEGKLTSPYYPDSFPIYYNLSGVRSLDDQSKAKLTDLIIQSRSDTENSSPMKTALAITSLIRLNYPAAKLSSAIDYLLETEKNGCWAVQPFCIDPTRDGKPHAAESNSLSAALCLEALTLYKRAIALPARSAIFKKIKEEAYANLSPKLATTITTALGKIESIDNNHTITGLPSIIDEALKCNVNKEYLNVLGTANTYGWIGYTLLDDVYDDNAAVTVIPAANHCLRNLYTNYYFKLNLSSAFVSYFAHKMDNLESAHHWEMLNTKLSTYLINHKLPDYGDYTVLADKSFGHALSSLAVLDLAGYSPENQIFKSIESFFKHYLIARQLNDDAHDWKEDLMKRNINPVAAILINKHQQQHPNISIKNINSYASEIDILFQSSEILYVAKLIQNHLNQAIGSISNNDQLKPLRIWQDLLAPTQRAVHEVIDLHKKAKQFIASYNKA